MTRPWGKPMSRNIKILVLASLALANLVLFVYLIQRQSKASRPEPAQKDMKELPVVEIIDDTGKRAWLNQLAGRVVLVQFVDPRIDTQLQSLSKLVTAFDENQVAFVLINRDSQDLRSHLPKLSANTLIVQHSDANLREVFNVPSCCERRFIFDQEGKLQYKDYYYEIDLGPRIRSLLENGDHDIPSAMVQALRSINTGRFVSLREQVRRSKSGKSVVILLDSVNTSCPSGEIVKSANRFANAHKEIPLTVILLGNYTPSDVENFKINLQVFFSVETADWALTEKWSAVLREFGESSVNGSMFLLERENLVAISDLNTVN